MMYVRYLLSLRNAEDLLHERGIDVTYEIVRFRRSMFGTIFAANNAAIVHFSASAL
jgi:putative transposase